MERTSLLCRDHERFSTPYEEVSQLSAYPYAHALVRKLNAQQATQELGKPLGRNGPGSAPYLRWRWGGKAEELALAAHKGA